ncbi:MAG: CHAD domain-containing protein [Chloroflexota bacterium]
MEIEAKFSLPDLETFRRLLTIEYLAGFTLSTGRIKKVCDTYLDTADRLVLAAGYACRLRDQDEGLLLTLKGLGHAEGAVHRREELEAALPPGTSPFSPADWPPEPVCHRVRELIHDAPLAALFELRQSRTVRQASLGERQVAEMSLDEALVVAGERQQAFLELEVELAPEGAEDDLAAMAAVLRDEWGLEAQPRAKFERGLAFLDEAAGGRLFTPSERAICRRIAAREDRFARRAKALLALDEGTTQAQAGQRAGFSSRQVRRWLGRFRRDGLSLFPAALLERPEAFSVQEEVRPSPEPEPARLKLSQRPGLDADDSMVEAARKTLVFHFERMVYHEPGTRLGEDIEELHDMRVATRRMRAAFDVFGDFLDMTHWQPYLKGLRRTGRALGAVRDLDVFWEKTQLYLNTLPPERQSELEPLRRVWEAEREAARAYMLAYLDSERYLRFKERFAGFLEKPGAGAAPILSEQGEPLPHRLRHVAPVAVYQRLAGVRAYDEWVTAEHVPLGRLHQLRIAAKGLRYTVEYFREVLGPEARALIDEIKTLQDHLGNLQDAVVASQLLRDFLTWGTWGHTEAGAEKVERPVEPIVAPGVAAYLAERQRELERLVQAFPQVWTRFRGSDFSQLVAQVVAVL